METTTNKAGGTAAETDRAVRKAWQALDAALAEQGAVDLSWIDPPPSPDGWTLDLRALRLLTALVTRLKPRHILEFGSGLSTRVLARACADIKPRICISSVDHDPEFGGIAAGEFAALGAQNCRVRFQIAPVVARECGGKLLPVYNVNPARLASKRPVDLAVIDGPTVTLGGREGTLYQTMDVARPGTLVLLDDAGRASERAALHNWRENLGDAIEVRNLEGFSKGMAAIVVRKPVPRSELGALRFAVARREIESLVPAGEAYACAGDEWWPGEVAADRRSIPLLSRDGVYWGPPEDDAAAIEAVAGLAAQGVRFLVIGWPNLWWIDCYAGLIKHLDQVHRRVIDNDRLVAFELKR